MMIPLVPPASSTECETVVGKPDVTSIEITQPLPGTVALPEQFARLLLFCTLKNIKSVLVFGSNISVTGEHAVVAGEKISSGAETARMFPSLALRSGRR